MKPRISLIVPIFNTDKYLSKCLDSIFQQDYLNLEVIAVNDGSTDNSGDILESYSKRESRLVVLNQNNRGVVAARSLGLYNASGEWVMFVDSDDYLLPNCLSRMFEEAISRKADIVAANIVYDYDEKKINRSNEKPDEINFKGWSKALLADTVIPALYAKIYKKSLFDGITISDDLKIGEDFIITILLFSRSQEIVLIDFPCYGYLQRGDSVMHQPSKKAIASIPKFIEWVIDFYSNTDFILDEKFNDELAYFAVNRYYLYLSWGGFVDKNSRLTQIINNNFLGRVNVRKRIPFWRCWILYVYKYSSVLGRTCYKFLTLFTRLIKMNA